MVNVLTLETELSKQVWYPLVHVEYYTNKFNFQHFSVLLTKYLKGFPRKVLF